MDGGPASRSEHSCQQRWSAAGYRFHEGYRRFPGGENEIRVNLEAAIILTGLFVPLLAKNKNSAIVNVTSGLGFVPAARMTVYSASKAGLHAYSMAIRHQLSKVGIKVFEVGAPKGEPSRPI